MKPLASPRQAYLDDAYEAAHEDACAAGYERIDDDSGYRWLTSDGEKMHDDIVESAMAEFDAALAVYQAADCGIDIGDGDEGYNAVCAAYCTDLAEAVASHADWLAVQVTA